MAKNAWCRFRGSLLLNQSPPLQRRQSGPKQAGVLSARSTGVSGDNAVP
ncbi:MAG: hypothetical protein AB1815_07020 [Bacillota bacterium]